MGQSIMITKLRGLLDETGPNWAVVEVQGVFYHVSCSTKTLDQLRERGVEYVLFTEMIVREDMMALYGFARQTEREWFRLLTSVQGVGNKAALAILSVAVPEDLHVAISAQDKGLLTQAEGVGPKLAARIVNELKDKVGSLWQSAAPGPQGITLEQPSQATSDGFHDAVSALVNLGYKSFEANQAVALVRQEGHNERVEDIIRLALMRLSKSA
jgi:Holliday junction DNA helicase, RuvA subunit